MNTLNSQLKCSFNIAVGLLLIIHAPQSVRGCSCQDGWIVFKDSCYKVSQSTLPWEEAKSECERYGANLFVANTDSEVTVILKGYGVKSNLNWIGLSYLSQTWDEGPIWETGGHYDYNQLTWLNNQDFNHGHTTGNGIDCVAYFANTVRASYVNWYSCNLQLYYICERNSTISSIFE